MRYRIDPQEECEEVAEEAAAGEVVMGDEDAESSAEFRSLRRMAPDDGSKREYCARRRVYQGFYCGAGATFL